MTLRVLELGGAAAGYAGRLFVHLGAEVVRLSEPEPDAGTYEGMLAQAQSLYLHGGKQLRRDIGGPLAVATAAAIGDTTPFDIVIVESSPAELASRNWHEVPAKVRVAITPFGLDGPACDWQATGSVLLAMGGYTALTGDPGRAPLTLPGHYAEYQGGQYAYLTALATWLAVRDGRMAAERTIDVSMWEAVLSLSQFTTVLWTFSRKIRARHGNDWENLAPLSLFPCADGWFVVNIVPNFWKPFTLMLDRPELLLDPRFVTNDSRMVNKKELHQIISETLGHRTMAELLELGQRHARVPTGTALSLQQVLDDEHLRARGAWEVVTTRDGSDVRVPAIPFRYATRFQAEAARRESTSARRVPAGGLIAGPLSSTRVLDFTHVWAGPLASRILADLGADVVKVEAPFVRGPANVGPSLQGIYPDDVLGAEPWNRQGVFNKLNRNKLSVAVDIKQAEGRTLVTELVRDSDVVIDNFSARAMPSMGFDIDALRAQNPAIVHVTMPGFGVSGPHSDFVAFGPSVEPMSGYTALLGYSPEEPRLSSMALPDAIAGVSAAAAVVTGLYRRDIHGETGLIECALHEGAIAMLGEFYAELQLTGRAPPRRGNAHAVHAPQGVYRCAADAIVGNDAWIALSIVHDEQWRALVASLALPDEEAWAKSSGRRDAAARIDACIEAATRLHDRLTLMRLLQRAGVPAGAVMVAPDWLADPHLNERDFFVQLAAPHIDARPYPGLPVRIDGLRATGWFAAPRLGEHNALMACERLGWTRARYAAACASGAFVQRPPDPSP
jgi:crotonobetainyl-CoA:carnitine CoA-transferase CaiB-like acyl-CoA transferase